MKSYTIADDVSRDNKKIKAHLQRVVNAELEKLGIHDDGINANPVDKELKIDKLTWGERKAYLMMLIKDARRMKRFSLKKQGEILRRYKQVNARIKRDKIFRDAGQGFVRVALSMGRGAFQAVVAMNLNALANKLQKLKEWNKADSIIKTWKDVGGKEANFWKVVNIGAKRKKLFLSKGAKDRYIKKFGAINGICDDDCICAEDSMNGPHLAALAAAAAPVLAALIPKMIKAFGSVGTPEAQANAESTADHGKEIVAQGTSNLSGASIPGGNTSQAPEPTVSDYIDEETINAGNGELGQALGSLVKTGFTKLLELIKKKKPKAAKVVDKIEQAGDDYVTGAYLRQSGAKDLAYKAQKFGGAINYAIPVFGIAALGAILLLKKGKR